MPLDQLCMSLLLRHLYALHSNFILALNYNSIMSQLNPLHIYKHLNRSNCKKCGLPSCMAFAHALIAGKTDLDACPYLEQLAREELAPMVKKRTTEEGFQASVKALREEVAAMDLEAVADRLGGTYSRGKLTLRCLGKDFSVDDAGTVESPCHVNIWIETILLSYCRGEGTGGPSGKWVSFAELRGAATTAGYFTRRVEEPLKGLADEHTEIFFDMMGIFGGSPVDGFPVDHAVVIHPLPRVPYLILYSRAEEDFGSTLRVLFDSTADTYLGLDLITYVGRGIVEMVRTIIDKHQECSADTLFL